MKPATEFCIKILMEQKNLTHVPIEDCANMPWVFVIASKVMAVAMVRARKENWVNGYVQLHYGSERLNWLIILSAFSVYSITFILSHLIYTKYFYLHFICCFVRSMTSIDSSQFIVG